jgi:adenine-specific DNA-methyltransferase
MTEPRQKNKLGQYFTPPHIARLMVGMLNASAESAILEPSSGTGVFLDALRDANYQNVQGVELDHDLATHAYFQVENASFVSWRPTHAFAAVIGNPPYIRWKNLEDEQRTEITLSRHWGSLFNSLSDYLNVFIVNSIDVLQDEGELIFITPSFWLHTQHAEGVRNYLLENGAISHLVSFGESQVFEGVSSSIIIFRFVKTKHSVENIHHYQYSGPRRVGEAVDLQDETLFRKTSIPQFKQGQHWTIATSQDQRELGRFQSWCASNSLSLPGFDSDQFETIGDYCTIANGMVSGLDKAFRVDEALFSRLTEVEKSVIIPVVKGADLSSLVTFKSSRYIDLPAGLTEGEVRSTYPNLIAHLDTFRDQLLKRYSYGRDLPFWEWAFRRSESFLCSDSPKIFVPCKERITNKDVVRFSLVPRGSIATQDVTAFAPKPGIDLEIEYICAFLSLPEVTRWIRMRGLIKGGVAEFSERPLASIPFRSIDKSSDGERDKYRQIVDLVRSCKSSKEVQVVQDGIRDIFISMGLPEWTH